MLSWEKKKKIQILSVKCHCAEPWAVGLSFEGLICARVVSAEKNTTPLRRHTPAPWPLNFVLKVLWKGWLIANLLKETIISSVITLWNTYVPVKILLETVKAKGWIFPLFCVLYSTTSVGFVFPPPGWCHPGCLRHTVESGFPWSQAGVGPVYEGPPCCHVSFIASQAWPIRR